MVGSVAFPENVDSTMDESCGSYKDVVDSLGLENIESAQRLGHHYVYEYYQKLQNHVTKGLGSSLFLERMDQESSESDKYCICNSPPSGDMVMCWNRFCPEGKWFHVTCVQWQGAWPWHCPSCRQNVPGG